MQDLQSTDPTPRKRVLDHADYTGSTRQHELDPTDHTDHARCGIDISALKDLAHDLYE